MPRTLIVSFFLATSLFTSAQPGAPKPAYDVSLPREERIQLAKSAAPPEITDHSTVYVLDKAGYAKVQEGTNGFSCFVDRQTPFNLEPTCFDAEGSASTLPTRLFAEEQRALGKSEEEIKTAIDNGYKSGKFHAPAKPGIVYMMSDQGVLFVSGKSVHIPPHLIFMRPTPPTKTSAHPRPRPTCRG